MSLYLVFCHITFTLTFTNSQLSIQNAFLGNVVVVPYAVCRIAVKLNFKV